MQNVK